MSKEVLANPSRRRLFQTKSALQPRLPWVQSEEVFVDKCTQCASCIDICETKIINKDPQGYPYIDFSRGECTFCNQCIESCEVELFIPTESREQTTPWQGNFTINEKCLATNNIYCQSCRDVCETQAIQFSYINKATQKMNTIPTPELNLTDCSQCGACVEVCPQNAISLKLKTTREIELINTSEIQRVQNA